LEQIAVAKPSRKIKNTSAEASPSQSASVWSPLRHSVFRALWIASIVSNIGSWMQDVGESWLMTSLTLSPVLVALVETAGSLPVVLTALPAGALADIVDRRRLLIVMQVWMVIVATAMGVMALTGHMTTGRLLSLTFLLGIGSAVSNPVWQAITPELVPSEDLPAALSLGGVAVNIARAIGPAIGGLIIAASGQWVVFFINAVSFLAVFLVVYRWQPAPRTSKLPPEEIISAMRAGTRYLRHSPELQTVLLRCAGFIVCASALWALLPQQARRGLGLSSFGYGALLGCLGIGAIAGAWLLPTLRKRFAINQLVAGGSIVFALSSALLTSAVGLVIGLLFTWRYRLVAKKNLSLAPSMHWPEPVMRIESEAGDGPAITSIEYRIDPKTAEEFLDALKDLRRIRLRDGAIRWNVLRDSADPERYLEIFVTESWGEHLRQHERITAEDRKVEQRVQAFHVGTQPPKTTHLIAEELPK